LPVHLRLSDFYQFSIKSFQELKKQPKLLSI
jgi:hypothetical protein